MEFTTKLSKLETKQNEPIQYYLNTPDKNIDMNQLLGKEIEINFEGDIFCVCCGRKTKKSYSQGHCFVCSKTSPLADIALIKPELDLSHLGISRDIEWSKRYSLVEHYVYLSNTGNIKVGITNHTQIPTRWIDQGATEAIRIAKVPNRYTSGLLEVELKKHFTDVTNWRKMLSMDHRNKSLLNKAIIKAQKVLSTNFKKYLIDDEITSIHFPITQYPKKVNSLNLEQKHQYKGTLSGIKGQYLIFEDGTVFNIRKHSGYQVNIKIN